MFSKFIAYPDFRSAVLGLYAPPIRAKATRYKIAESLDSFARVVNPATTQDVHTASVASWVAARRADNVNTVISQLKAFRSAVNYGLEEGWFERAPAWRRVMPRSASSASRRHYSRSQVVALLSHLRNRGDKWRDRRLYALTATIAYTGLRFGEAIRLHVGDVHLSESILGVVARHRLKTVESAAAVPLPDELVPILIQWMPQTRSVWMFPGERRRGPWTGGGPGYKALDQLQKAGAEIGIEDVTFHSLRHTLAKLLVGEWGATRDQARAVLRHSDVRTTEDYYLHADDPELLRRAVRHVTYAE